MMNYTGYISMAKTSISSHNFGFKITQTSVFVDFLKNCFRWKLEPKST